MPSCVADSHRDADRETCFMNILVTGGAGYIGSHACKALAQEGYTPVSYDNLVYGHRWAVRWGPLEEGDIADRVRLDAVIQRYRPAAVMHFAAYAYVGESVQNPGKYYRNNVAGSLALLEALRDRGIDKLIFSSTCATYGVPEQTPIDEQHPQRPINLGNGQGFSVHEVIEQAKSVTGKRIPVEIGPRRPGDPARLVGDASRIRRALGWQPEYADLASILATAWRWHTSRWEARTSPVSNGSAARQAGPTCS